MNLNILCCITYSFCSALESWNNYKIVSESQLNVFLSAGLAHRCMESPPGSYTQIIPSVETSARHIHRHGLPPSLPPQLLQVLLNKDSSQANSAAV